MMLSKLLFTAGLALSVANSAQAQDPCSGAQQSVTDSLVHELASLVANNEAPCQRIRDQIAENDRLLQETQEDLEAAGLEQQFWSQQANEFIAAQKAIIDKNFGENLLATTTLISTELVLDAYAVTKAVKGARYGQKALSMSGTVRTKMLQKFKREFQEALASEILSKGQAVVNGIQDESWSWWELVPFVSPIKRLNRMAGTDDAVEALGAAQRKASEHSAKAYLRRLEAERELETLTQRIRSLNEQLGRCLGQSEA